MPFKCSDLVDVSLLLYHNSKKYLDFLFYEIRAYLLRITLTSSGFVCFIFLPILV